jgi:hypothetical protein
MVERKPNQAPSPEPETKMEKAFIGLQARLLLGDDALNPQNMSLPKLVEKNLLAFEQRNYSPFNNASTNERLKIAAVPEDNLEEAIIAWSEDTAAKLRDDFTQTQGFDEKNAKRWDAAISRVLNIDPKNTTTADVRGIYDKYFTGDRKESQVKAFINDVVNDFVDINGSGHPIFNYVALQQNLDCVQWLSHIFGQMSAEVITQMVDAEAKMKLNYLKKELIKKANAKQTTPEGQETTRLNILNPQEARLLQFVWENKDLIQPQPPPQEPAKPSRKKAAESVKPAVIPVSGVKEKIEIKGEEQPVSKQQQAAEAWEEVPKPQEPELISSRTIKGKVETYLIWGTKEHPLVTEERYPDGSVRVCRHLDKERLYKVPVMVYYDADLTEEEKELIQEAVPETFSQLQLPSHFLLKGDRPASFLMFGANQENGKMVDHYTADRIFSTILNDGTQIEFPHQAVVFTNKDIYSEGQSTDVVSKGDLGTVISFKKIIDIQDTASRREAMRTSLRRGINQIYE